MGTTPRNEFIRAAFSLSKSDPRAWEEFMIAFDEYVKYELEKATASPSGEAQIILGMSRRLLDIRNDLRDIVTLMSKIAK